MSDIGSHQSPALQAGTPAPDFTLHTTPDQSVSLSQFRGNPTILAFYPADFSPSVITTNKGFFTKNRPP
jgi:peroxiredoxin